MSTSPAACRYQRPALVIIPTTVVAARALVRTAEPTDRGLPVGSAVRTDRSRGVGRLESKASALACRSKAEALDSKLALPAETTMKAVRRKWSTQ